MSGLGEYHPNDMPFDADPRNEKDKIKSIIRGSLTDPNDLVSANVWVLVSAHSIQHSRGQ